MNLSLFLMRIGSLKARQPMQLTFANTELGRAGAHRLARLLDDRHTIEMSDSDREDLKIAVAKDQPQQWKRTYTLVGLEDAPRSYHNFLACCVESVIAGGEHRVDGLSSKDPEARIRAFEVIEVQILTPKFVGEMQELGAKVAVERIIEGEVFSPLFVVRVHEQPISCVKIDGWSGQIIRDALWTGKLYDTPAQVQNTLIEAVEDMRQRLAA